MSDTPELVIANGTVVNSSGRQQAHVVVRDGAGRLVSVLGFLDRVPS